MNFKKLLLNEPVLNYILFRKPDIKYRARTSRLTLSQTEYLHWIHE